ncbi:YdcF family protein [Faecalimonas sp.]
MSKAFFSMGILCILYYLLIVLHTRNWKATFSRFWIIFGVVQFVVGFCVDNMKKTMYLPIQIGCTVLFLFFFAVIVVILSAMVPATFEELSMIVILGACVKGKTITGALQKRLDKGLPYLLAHENTKVIVSGGRGKGEEVTEAFAMKKYLEDKGISSERIIMEELSHSTEENLKYSLSYIKNANEKMGIVTNNFHIYRSIKLAKRIGYKDVVGIGAGVDPVLFLNYLVREFFAVVYLVLFHR